jgi:hypothetical protein
MAMTLSGVGAPAFAADQHSKVPASPVDCWLDLPTGRSLCVPVGDDLAAAVNEATGVHLLEESDRGMTIDLVTGDTYETPTSSAQMKGISAEVSRSMNATAAALIVVKFYIDANYATGGGVWNATAPDGCYPGGNTPAYGLADFGASSPQSGYYNNRISSFKSFYSCRTKLFDNANYTGASIGYSATLATLGSMNDRANSAYLAY